MVGVESLEVCKTWISSGVIKRGCWNIELNGGYSNMSMVPSPFSIGKRGCSIPRLEQTM